MAPFIGYLEQRRALEVERRLKTKSDGVCTGCWRGGYELEEKDLPSEDNLVDQFIYSINPGSIHLYYGCRDDNDFLYRDALTSFVEDGTLTSLNVARSRAQEEKRYVTHLLREQGALLARKILKEGAYVYICGDGNRMAKDVFETIKQALVEHGAAHSIKDAEQADIYLKEMRARQRYLLDIWS